MSAVTIQQMADRVAAMMEEKLRVPGRDLDAKLRKGGRLLPRRVRGAAKNLGEAAQRAQNPKLLVKIDFAKVSADYDICVHHLASVSPRGGFKSLAVHVAATLALGLLLALGVWLFIQRTQGGL